MNRPRSRYAKIGTGAYSLDRRTHKPQRITNTMSNERDHNRFRYLGQAKKDKPLLDNGINPLLKCNVEPDIRPFEWPDQPSRPNLNWREPEQLNLYEETTMNSEMQMLMRQTLVRPIAFHRVFAEITGTATAGLFLSQCYYWSQLTVDPKGFYKSPEEWKAETKMTRYEQEKARKTLKDLGLVIEQLKGSPPRLYYLLDHDKLLELILAQARAFIATNQFVEGQQIDLSGVQFVEGRQINLSKVGKSLTIQRPNTESLDQCDTTGRASEEASPYVSEEDLEAQLDDFFSFDESSSALGEDGFALTLPVIRDEGEIIGPIEPEAKAVEPLEQPPLFSTPAPRAKTALKGGILVNNHIPVPYQYHKILYRMCFMADGDSEIMLLSLSQKNRVTTVLSRMLEAKVDMTRLKDFQTWWAGTWMSKDRDTRQYQAPRPEQVAEFWSTALKQLGALADEEVVMQEQVSTELLERAMQMRAQSRNGGDANGEG